MQTKLKAKYTSEKLSPTGTITKQISKMTYIQLCNQRRVMMQCLQDIVAERRSLEWTGNLFLINTVAEKTKVHRHRPYHLRRDFQVLNWKVSNSDKRLVHISGPSSV